MIPSELVEWRKKHGYSQISLSKALCVAPITVYRWEKGMREIPSFLHLALECLALKGGEKRSTGRNKKSV